MKRFMKFSILMSEVVNAGLVQPGLIIKCVATDTVLLLNSLVFKDSTHAVLGFCTEDRVLVQTIDPESVWGLVNINLEGDVGNE